MAYIKNLIRAVVVSLALFIPLYTLKSEYAFETRVETILLQNRKNTNAQILESQAKVLSTVNEVSKATRMLAIILCQQQADPNICINPDGEPHK
ncbi:hypothetical protein [Pseudomonas cannabina]|nr:hypothetical protein [Pseudomonas cannabina]